MRENVDQNISEYGHFLRNIFLIGHAISLQTCWRDIAAYFIYLGLLISSLLKKAKIKERVKQSQKCENLVQVSSIKYCLANLFRYVKNNRVCFTSVLKIWILFYELAALSGVLIYSKVSLYSSFNWAGSFVRSTVQNEVNIQCFVWLVCY